MSNYPTSASASHPTLLSSFTLTITPATCDCKLLNWINPVAQSLTTTVLKEVSDSITIKKATVDPTSKTPTPAIRACYRTDLGPAPGCDETTNLVSVVENSNGILPDYMILSSEVLTVSPTLSSQIRTYIMKVTHDTQFEDANISYTTLTITINACVITRVEPPPAPSPVTYSIHALNDVIVDLSSPGFVQQPACGYTLT